MKTQDPEEGDSVLVPQADGRPLPAVVLRYSPGDKYATVRVKDGPVRKVLAAGVRPARRPTETP
jgi:hypothetical protein